MVYSCLRFSWNFKSNNLNLQKKNILFPKSCKFTVVSLLLTSMIMLSYVGVPKLQLGSSLLGKRFQGTCTEIVDQNTRTKYNKFYQHTAHSSSSISSAVKTKGGGGEGTPIKSDTKVKRCIFRTFLHNLKNRPWSVV